MTIMIKLFYDLFVLQKGILKARFLFKATVLKLHDDKRPCKAAFTRTQFHIDTVSRFRRKPHRNRCGLEVFTRNRFRTVYVMPKSSQTKGIWVRKNLTSCSSLHGEKYVFVHLE